MLDATRPNSAPTSPTSPTNIHHDQHHHHHETPFSSSPLSPKQSHKSNPSRRASSRFTSTNASNSQRRLSVNLLLNKLTNMNANTTSSHTNYSLNNNSNFSGAHSLLLSSNINNSITTNGFSALGSESLTIPQLTHQGSQIIMGVPYREGWGYRKTTHWPYLYNKRYFVLKNHHLRIYRTQEDFKQHQILSAQLISNNSAPSSLNSSNTSYNNGFNSFSGGTSVNSSSSHNNNCYEDDNTSIISTTPTSLAALTSSHNNNPVFTDPANMINEFILYKIPLKYCKLTKFHTVKGNDGQHSAVNVLDYRSEDHDSGGAANNCHDDTFKEIQSFTKTTAINITNSDDDELEEFELHFLPPADYTGSGVVGSKSYKINHPNGGESDKQSEDHANTHGTNEEGGSFSVANSAVFKLKFKKSKEFNRAIDWFSTLDKAIFLASKASEEEERSSYEQKEKVFDEEEWLSKYKQEQQQDMMELPVFLRPLQMQMQHNEELLDQQEKLKAQQENNSRSMSLKKRLSLYFTGGSSSSNNNINSTTTGGHTNSNGNKRHSKTLDISASNVESDDSSSYHTPSSGNDLKRRSGYIVDDNFPEITDMAQLQNLIRQNDEILANEEGNGYSSSHQPSSSSSLTPPSKPASPAGGSLLSVHAEEQKMSKMKRLSTNLAEFFSKKKPTTSTSGSNGDHLHAFNDSVSECHSTISSDPLKKKQEKRKSLFGKLLSLNKH
nr:unnamed protein product [Naegleria fowleri]